MVNLIYLRKITDKSCLWAYGKLRSFRKTIPEDCAIPVQIALLIFLCGSTALRYILKFVRETGKKYPTFVISLGVFFLTIFSILPFFPYQRSGKLIFFFVYMTVACTAIPLLTPQLVIRYGAWFNPYLIAIIGGIGTCLGTLIDYGLLSFAFRYEKVNKIKSTRIYQYSARFFHKIAFISMVVAGFTPIPFDPFRFLAISMGYSKLKYVLAVFIGRSTRYFLLAEVGKEFDIPGSILWGSFALMTIIALVTEIYRRIKSRRQS